MAVNHLQMTESVRSRHLRRRSDSTSPSVFSPRHQSRRRLGEFLVDCFFLLHEATVNHYLTLCSSSQHESPLVGPPLCRDSPITAVAPPPPTAIRPPPARISLRCSVRGH
ncbi:hypothetical protein M6B38_390860 [Iris pallida]|uniref:Uncharacterized protein n=1 Tax=Iris pallida TaxID=29817 RepID=A0AAX6FZL3_IRIPA|nr:hypothetical protein M6B38_390860 [Iris pallida]